VKDTTGLTDKQKKNLYTAARDDAYEEEDEQATTNML